MDNPKKEEDDMQFGPQGIGSGCTDGSYIFAFSVRVGQRSWYFGHGPIWFEVTIFC